MGIGSTIIHQHVPQVVVPSPYIQPNTQNWQPSIVNQSPMDVQIVSPNQPAYQYEPQTLTEIVPQQNVQVIPCVQQSNYAFLTPQGQTCVHVSSPPPPPPPPTPSRFIVGQEQGQIQSQQGHLNLDILLQVQGQCSNVSLQPLHQHPSQGQLQVQSHVSRQLTVTSVQPEQEQLGFIPQQCSNLQVSNLLLQPMH